MPRCPWAPRHVGVTRLVARGAETETLPGRPDRDTSASAASGALCHHLSLQRQDQVSLVSTNAEPLHQLH